AECQCRGSWGKSIKCIVVSKLEGILTTWTGAIRAAPVARFHQGGGFPPRGLRLVAPGALQSFADHFVFPLVERHAVGEEAVAIRCRVVAIARRIELYVADFQLAALGERAGAFDDVLQFTHIAWPIMTDQELHGSG